jgi:hypothetical protein
MTDFDEDANEARRSNFLQLSRQYAATKDASDAANLLRATYTGEGSFTSRAADARAGQRIVKTLCNEYGEREATQCLAILLRDHQTRDVEDQREVRLRDGFDSLLSFYSLMELACLLGYVDDRFDDEFAVRARQDLTQPQVREYYEVHYPLLLPTMFRERLDGRRREIGTRDDEATAFPLFLDLNSKLENDEGVDTFLWFLDDGSWGGYDIEDLLDVTKRPEDFLRRLGRPPGARANRLDLAIDGLRTFLGFCHDLDALLSSYPDNRLLQSALWHHHAYWFQHVRQQVGSRISAAIRGLASWDEGVAHRDAEALQAAVQRLTSGLYDEPLRAFKN